jgi:hypothetical protein
MKVVKFITAYHGLNSINLFLIHCVIAKPDDILYLFLN